VGKDERLSLAEENSVGQVPLEQCCRGMHGAATLIIDLDATGNFVWAWTVREKSENGRGARWGNVLLLLRCKELFIHCCLLSQGESWVSSFFVPSFVPSFVPFFTEEFLVHKRVPFSTEFLNSSLFCSFFPSTSSSVPLLRLACILVFSQQSH
jgi:hypothetical protein